MTSLRSWHTLAVHEVSSYFDVEIRSGLSGDEARRRLAQFGPNRLSQGKQEPIWEVFLEEIREPMILLLLATGVLYALWGDWRETLTLFAIILAVLSIEVFNERRAERAIAGLRKLAEPTAFVRRDGQSQEVPAETVVPGDVILLQAGRRVPGDARLIEAYSLAADEALLTGESVPVDKEADLILAEETPLTERPNLIFAGTTILRGRGTAIVVATGMATELGRVATLASEIQGPRTPLQQTMRELTRWMVWVALGCSALVPLLAGLRGNLSLQQILLTGLSLAFATIPEELPLLITMVLALGAYRLSQQKAIVKRLWAAETLSAVTFIATDKTGTLTENRLKVNRWYPESLGHKLLEIGVLCNSSANGGARATGPGSCPRPALKGDPLEIALLQAAQEAGLQVDELRQAYPLRQEFGFDNARKMMSAVYEREGRFWVALKGAPERVLARSTRRWVGEGERPFSEADQQEVLAMTAWMANEGLRVLAFAEKTLPLFPFSRSPALGSEEIESDLTFVGLMGLADPPRPEAKEAIATCRAAGVRLVMITGDHPLTAQAIARQVGLDTDGNGQKTEPPPELDRLSDAALQEMVYQVGIYARTTPEHKLRIVRALRESGEVVAVTGDGINDTPALAAADIGIAMGETGSDVAREAADIVLADDNLATIVHALREGRRLFANLKKAIRYYLACKVALVSTTLLPALLAVPIPFSPLQIIFMELFMDLGASATFIAERAESDLMRRPPRNPKIPFMDRTMVAGILCSATGLFAAVTFAYLITWFNSLEAARAQTLAFVTWLLGHVFLALNLRSEREPLFRLGLFSNPLMLLWGAATAVFLLLATLVPEGQAAFKTVAPDGREWALAIGVAGMGTFWIEVRKWFS